MSQRLHQSKLEDKQREKVFLEVLQCISPMKMNIIGRKVACVLKVGFLEGVGSHVET